MKSKLEQLTEVSEKPLEPVEDYFVGELNYMFFVSPKHRECTHGFIFETCPNDKCVEKEVALGFPKLKDLLHRHEAHVREKWEREIVEGVEKMKSSISKIHLSRGDTYMMERQLKNHILDNVISLITKKDYEKTTNSI